MSTSTAAFIASAICQLGGLVIGVVGDLRTRRRADDLLRRTAPREPPERSYPAPFPRATTAARPWQGVASYGEKHEAGQRDRYIQRQDVATANALIEVQKARDDLAQSLYQEGVETDKLRDSLRDILTGKDRIIAAALVALGIIFAVIGAAS